MAVGILLCTRSVLWTLDAATVWAWALAGAGVLLALVGYVRGFHRVAGRNMDRILAFAPHAPFYAFTGLRGYAMIGVMMATGIVLRNSSLPKLVLVLPYMAMGGVLLRGSADYFRRFFTHRREEGSH